MKNEQNAPKIRFKGFTDAWELREFSQLYKKVAEKNDLSFGTDKIISVANMYFKADTKESSDDYMKTYNIMRMGDIAFEGNKSKNYAHGRFVENTIGDGIVSHVFDVFRPITDYDLFFWKYMINNEGVMGRIMTRCTKASTMMTNLVADDFLKETISIPSIEEQRQIGAYFRTLDHLITLHQRKCETLQKLKKSMLQKMFPKNGSCFPEIRFAGFTDAWEQRELGEISDIVGGGTPGTSNPDYWDGDIDWYAPAEISEQIFINSSSRKITKSGFENSSAKMLPVGTVLFTSRAGIGKTAILCKEGCTNQGFQSIVPHENELDSYFIFSRTEELKRYGETKGAGSTFVEVSGKQMTNMTLMMPTSFEEQRQIGTYFRTLDHLITLHQRKLETLKKLKKAMLQKMFI